MKKWKFALKMRKWLTLLFQQRVILWTVGYFLHLILVYNLSSENLKWSMLDIGKEVLVTSSSSQYRFGLTAWCFMPNCNTNGGIAVFPDQNHGTRVKIEAMDSKGQSRVRVCDSNWMYGFMCVLFLWTKITWKNVHAFFYKKVIYSPSIRNFL